LLAELGEDGRVLAGGHSLIPMMKLRLAEPGHLIDLTGVEGLRSIAEIDDSIHIGAMTTQAEIIKSDALAERCPMLREAAELIADPQVRACGTIGGNVANGDPGNDMPAVMMALGASYVLRGPGGERAVSARDFYEGPFEIAIQAGEFVTGIRIPAPPAGQGQAYCKLKRKVGDYAIAAAAVALTLNGGACSQAAIALTNLGITPLYAEAASGALVGTTVDAGAIDGAVDLALAITDPASDLRGPAEYRKHAAGVMTRRAIEAALSRAKEG
jgi:carbon-monoxide dehydrogenase medium subunit